MVPCALLSSGDRQCDPSRMVIGMHHQLSLWHHFVMIVRTITLWITQRMQILSAWLTSPPLRSKVVCHFTSKVHLYPDAMGISYTRRMLQRCLDHPYQWRLVRNKMLGGSLLVRSDNSALAEILAGVHRIEFAIRNRARRPAAND